MLLVIICLQPHVNHFVMVVHKFSLLSCLTYHPIPFYVAQLVIKTQWDRATKNSLR